MSVPPLWRELRAPIEALALRRDPVMAGAGISRGHGEPVLLIPGYLAGDGSLATMTHWLRRLNYHTSRAGMWANADCTTVAVEQLERRLERQAARRGPVAIVGQSRGGVMARILAVRRPDLVRGIVALGSPLVDPLAVHPLLQIQARVMGLVGSLGIPHLLTSQCFAGPCCAAVRQAAGALFPPDVGFVSVYSRSDGVVRWRSCLDPGARHVEIGASHLGMGLHPSAFRAVGRALAAF